MKKCECVNCPEGTEFVDPFDGQKFVTSGGVAFRFNGKPVNPRRAYDMGFSFSKDFQFPEMQNRGAVTDFIALNLKIPRGTGCYVEVYKELSENVLNPAPGKYEKEHN